MQKAEVCQQIQNRSAPVRMPWSLMKIPNLNLIRSLTQKLKSCETCVRCEMKRRQLRQLLLVRLLDC